MHFGFLKVLFLFQPLWMLVYFSACGFMSNKNSDGPIGYDLNHPITIKLPLELDEISGIAYYGKDSCVFAIVDESGWLYKIYLNAPREIEKWRFSDKADYEDLELLDSNFFMLESNGDISVLRFFEGDSLVVNEFKFSKGKGNEFETLFYDDETQKLMVLCKDCRTDKKKQVSSFSFDPVTFHYEHTEFRIDVERLAKMTGESKLKFKPSAAAINPLSEELFILSSVNRLLVITDRKGELINAYRLNKKYFKQPEGITFMEDGTMIISNEAAGDGVANVLVFPFKKHPDKK